MELNDRKYHVSTPMGIHRLMAEPYDDREIFTSVSDLINYCKDGACYDGQRVICINGYNTNKYIYHSQEFIIKKYISESSSDNNPTSYSYMPIIKLNNNELKWLQIGDDHYLQIYYYNGYITPGAMDRLKYNNGYHRNTVFLDNPGGFSIYEYINIFADETQNSKIPCRIEFKHDNVSLYKDLNIAFPDPLENNEDINILKYKDITNEEDIVDIDHSIGNNYTYYINLFGGNVLKYANIHYNSFNTSYINNSILDIYIKANKYYKIYNSEG